jgi:hypothetical protein
MFNTSMTWLNTLHITTAHPWEVSCGALILQYKVIKSPGINTVDSKCLTPVDVAHYAFMSCSTLRLIVLSQGCNP